MTTTGRPQATTSASVQGGSAGPSSRASSRVLLIPPSPRMSNAPTPALTASFNLLGPRDEPNTPPTIMLTPASASNSASAKTSPTSSPTASRADGKGPGLTDGADEVDSRPRRASLTNSQLDAVREQLAQRKRAASASGPPIPHPPPAPSAPARSTPSSPQKPPGPTTMPGGRPRTFSQNLKMSPGVAAMLRARSDAKQPDGGASSKQDVARPPSDPRPSTSAPASSTIAKNRAGTNSSTTAVNKRESRRESISSVDSLPFGVASIALGQETQPSNGTISAAPADDRPASLPAVPSLPASFPSPPRHGTAPLDMDSPSGSLKRMTISPATATIGVGDKRELGGSQGSSKRFILTDFDDISGLEHSPAHAVVPDPGANVKGARRSRGDLTSASSGVGAGQVSGEDAVAQKAIVDKLLQEMGLDPTTTTSKDLAASLAAVGKWSLTGGRPPEMDDDEGDWDRLRNRTVQVDRNGLEFVVEEHTLSPVSERTELSSTLSTLRPLSLSHPPIRLSIREEDGERLGQVQGFRPNTATTPGWAARAGLRAKVGAILAKAVEARETPDTPSDVHTIDSAEEERLVKRMERRNRVAAATSDGTLPQYRPQSRASGPFVHRKSVPNSITSSIGDAEVLHAGPIFYRVMDPATGQPSWRDYLAIMTAEALYLSPDGSGSDTLEFDLHRCVALRPLQPNVRAESPVTGERSGTESPRIRGFTMVWDTGEQETLGCSKVRQRNEWIEAIVRAAADLGCVVQTPELPKPKATRTRPANGESSGSAGSEDTSTSTLRTELHRDLARSADLGDSQHLYSDEANKELSRRLQSLTEPPKMPNSGHSVGATHPGPSSPALSRDGDLFGMINRLRDMQPPQSTSAFYDKPPVDGVPASVDPERTPRQEPLPLKKVSPPRSRPPTGSRVETVLNGPSPARDLQRDLFALQTQLRDRSDDSTDQPLAGHLGQQLQSIHAKLGDVASRLQRGHEPGSSDAQSDEQPTIADKLDYMLSLCSILLESQHKVSTAVERTLRAQNSPVAEHHPVRTPSVASRASTKRSRKASSAAPPRPSSEPAAQVEAAPVEVAPVVGLHDAGFRRIEDLLGTILARMDARQELARAQKGKGSERGRSSSDGPSGREHVHFPEPGERFSLTDSDVRSILDIEADVALWKQRERGSLAKVASDLMPFGSLGPAQSTGGDHARHVAEERARAARRLEGRGSPRETDHELRAQRPPAPSPLRQSRRMTRPVDPNQQSKWSETTPRQSDPPVLETDDGDLASDSEQRTPRARPLTVRIDESGPTFAPSLPSSRPTSPESKLTRDTAPASKVSQHAPLLEAMMQTLNQQGDAARAGHAHQAEMTQYLSRLNQFWEVDLQRRNEDSRNLAHGVSDLQNQVAVLAQRIADVFAGQAAQPPSQPPAVETHPLPNNASVDSLPSQASVLGPPPDRSPTLVNDDLRDLKADLRDIMKGPLIPHPTSSFDSEPPLDRKQPPHKLRLPKRKDSTKGKKMQFGKKVPDLHAAFASVGKLWGGPTPVADRTERWGTTSPVRASPRTPRTPPATVGRARPGQAPNHDLSKVLGNLRLPNSVGSQGVQGLDVTEIMRLLRERNAQDAEDKRLADERDRDLYLGEDLPARRAQAEALERQREAEIARRQAKGLENLVGLYKDHITKNQSAMRKIMEELEASRKAERERGQKDSEVKDLEQRCEQLRVEEEQMTGNVRQLKHIIDRHRHGKDRLQQAKDRPAFDRYVPDDPEFATPRPEYGHGWGDSTLPTVDRDHGWA